MQRESKLADACGLFQGALQSVLEPDDLHEMFGWLESLVKNPFSEDDSAPVMPGTVRVLV